MRMLIFAIIISWVELTPLLAQTPSEKLEDRVVGTVYGKTIAASDVGLTKPIDPSLQFDARDTDEWEQMERIASAFGGPVMERFLKERKIDATADEIAAFKRNSRAANDASVREWEAELARLKHEIEIADLSKSRKAGLEKERAMLELFIQTTRDSNKSEPSDELARLIIVPWKIERELHRLYGGRVIFQQFGPEALDGRRRLFEEAEKKGDLTFDDPGVRHDFYYYANMKPGVIDEEALEHPWFLAPAAEK